MANHRAILRILTNGSFGIRKSAGNFIAKRADYHGLLPHNAGDVSSSFDLSRRNALDARGYLHINQSYLLQVPHLSRNHCSQAGFEHIVPEPDFPSFSTNGFVYQLLRSDNKNYQYSPGILDVRDVARVHIAGLHPLTKDHPKRVPVASPFQADPRDAIKYIADERPELRVRLADPSTVPVWPTYKLDVDLRPVEKAFGTKLDSYKTWKETILDAIDWFVGIEKQWKSKGLEVEVPTTLPVSK
ncbi:hypothetical protein FB45DRAFT_1020624 [Roridomyces roridus]|uniref:Uncharacterized protein n=1 Tax=Roridomyces roridus TaxID=1738132 RepID=A0AAD7CB41_9AGAR|nr:hypothetical protein FB45DRAFT_1020624 [Roridomyces roridus]